MGRDKATIAVGGRSLISVAVAALAEADRVTVVGGPDRSAELGLPWIPDDVPGEGPLGGLLTALGHARCDSIVVLACDLPAVSPRVPAHLLAALGDGDAIVPIVGGRPQWLASAWRIRARPRLAAAREAGVRSVHGAAAGLRLVYLLDDERAYVDVDTPADLKLVADGSRSGESPSLT